jgi:hypothetical protein
MENKHWRGFSVMNANQGSKAHLFTNDGDKYFLFEAAGVLHFQPDVVCGGDGLPLAKASR